MSAQSNVLLSTYREGSARAEWCLTLSCGHTTTRVVRRRRIGGRVFAPVPPRRVLCGACALDRAMRRG